MNIKRMEKFSKMNLTSLNNCFINDGKIHVMQVRYANPITFYNESLGVNVTFKTCGFALTLSV